MLNRTDAAFDAVVRDRLIDDTGRTYAELRRGLTPRYGRLWAELLGGYVGIAGLAIVVAALESRWGRLWLLIALAGGVGLGYALAYVQLFFHEAAHWNLAPGRRLNDILANLLIGFPSGQDITAYRRVHFGHHRHLGRPEDSEHSYFDALGIRLLLRMLTGIHAFGVIVERSRDHAEEARPSGRLRAGLVGLAFNALVVGGALLAGCSALAVGWVLAAAVFLPFFLTLRQILEHRDFAADPRTDYRRVAHGAVNRLFGDSLLARTLGSAGFNRHLLHHWEPQLSCTRLGDLERFLRRTELAAALVERSTTYWRAFTRLLHA